MDKIQHLSHQINRLYRKYFPKSSTREKAAKGGFWLSMGGASEHGFRFLRNMLLARILLPETFGMYAIILAINQLFEAFTQLGIKEAVIQNPNGNEREFLNGAFLISIIRGVGLYILAYYGAPYIAGFYDKSQIVPMMRFAFLSIIFTSSMSIRLYSELKKLNYKKWTLIFHGGSTLGIIGAIACGIYLKNGWALVYGFVLESFFRFLFSYIFAPFLPNFRFNKEYIHSLLVYSKGIFGLPILYFAFTKIDVFVLGKLCDDKELGLYTLVQGLAVFPVFLFNGIVGQLLLPLFSSVNNDRERLTANYKKALKLVSMFILPTLTLLACISPYTISLVYGREYAEIYPVYAILCGGVILRILGMVTGDLFFSIGKPELFRNATITRFVIICIIIYPLAYMFSIYGAAIANLISLLIWFTIVLRNVTRNFEITIKNQVLMMSRGVFISIIFVGVFIIIQIIIHSILT